MATATKTKEDLETKVGGNDGVRMPTDFDGNPGPRAVGGDGVYTMPQGVVTGNPHPKMPSLGQMFDTEVAAGVGKYMKHITAFLENYKVTLAKDGKPNIEKLIDDITSFAKTEVGAHFKDMYNAQWIPSKPLLYSLFEDVEKLVEDGKIRKEVRDQIIGLYDRAYSEYTVARTDGRIQTSPKADGVGFGEDYATRTSRKDLIPSINRAETVEKLAARIRAVTEEYMLKAKQWQVRFGNLDKFAATYAQSYATQNKS